MTPGYPLALSLAVSMAVLGSALPAQARQDDPSLFNRQARGELSEYGGARRVEQDLTQALKQSLSKKKAKNVILLIGDGMGDSEITVARNYARGAGGYFKGIDALPLTGQYTHYSLHKDSGLPDYVTDSAASATAWTTGVKSYNGAIGVDIHEQPHRNLLGWPSSTARPPATSPPPSCRTPPPPPCSPTSPLASATVPRPPASSARAMPWRTAAPARSPSSG